jgi:uncharacterized protein (DUF427 family)
MAVGFSGIRLEPFAGRVRVVWRGTVLAESGDALVLHEKGYPPRHYLPAEDVRTDLLVRSARGTYCPFKGSATYWSLAGAAGEDTEDVAWGYPEPLRGMEQLAGRIAFHQERVQVVPEPGA